jgi:hypothetical protein
MSVVPTVIGSLEEWANAVAALARDTALGTRLVFVPNERVAHALRRRLVEHGDHAALAGTRFLPLVQFARRVLADAGEPAAPNEAELTPVLVREAFGSCKLERLDAAQLLSLPGWDDAFARTLGELEAAGIAPAKLMESEDAHVRDVGRVFAAIAARTERVSPALLLWRATRFLADNPSLHREDASLAVVTGFESHAEAALLKSIPRLTGALWSVRPARAEHTKRLGELFGFEPQAADTQHEPTIELATYAGVHEEVEAAVSWVVEQIVDHRVPAQDIALLAPAPEVYASLLRSRLASLPWPDATAITLSERGSPLTQRSDGVRVLTALRALREGLPRERLAALLPWLRTRENAEGEEGYVRGTAHAWELLNEVACVGGEGAHLEAGLAWKDAWQRAVLRLEAPCRADPALFELKERNRAAHQLALASLGAAVDGLCGVLARVTAEEPLADVWQALRSWLRDSLRLPPAAPPAWAHLDRVVADYSVAVGEGLRGTAALDWLAEQVEESLVRDGRFGAPAIYVGSLQGVRGLSFRAVRVLGLVEGALPSAVREDAVLSDAARAELSSLLFTSRVRAHRQLASLEDTLRATRERIVLCAPRVSMDGGARQPAAVLLDITRMLGAEPTSLEDSFTERALALRASERKLRLALPLSASQQLSRVAAGDRGLLVERTPATSLAAIRAIAHREAPGAHDGLLPGVIPVEALAGLSAERPISASRLEPLVACPHRYLLQNVLRLEEPTGPAPSHELDALTFGSLLHDIAEDFWQEHGSSFGARQHSLAHHQEVLRVVAAEHFEALRARYPFASEEAAGAVFKTLCEQLVKLTSYDWNEGAPRSFVAAERSFGYDEPCVVDTAAGPLHVRGKIDRLDVEGDTLLVRDLKTGKSKARRRGDDPDPAIDLQLGLYSRVVEARAEGWGVPGKIGVAYVYLRRGKLERLWPNSEYATLRAATDAWLAAARDTLLSGAFVRSPDESDCQFCAYQPICETEHARTEAVLADQRVPVRLRVLKSGGKS